MGGRALGRALGANQLRLSGFHPGHVPSGASSTSPVPTGRHVFLAVTGSCIQRPRAPCAQQPGGGGGTGIRLPPRREATGPRPLRQGPLGRSRPVPRSTLQAPTARGAGPGRPGQRPHMPFLGREPRGGGGPRAAVRVTSDPSSSPAPAGPVHQPPPRPRHCREGGPQPFRAWPSPVSRPLWAVLPWKLLGHAHGPHCGGEGRGQPGAGCIVVFWLERAVFF